MRDIAADKIAYIILLAREMDCGRENVAPQSAARAELREFLGSLNADALASLIALMWIGRDTFAPEELAEAIETARDERADRPADYLLAEPQLADFLESGMEALGLSPEEEAEAVQRPV